MRGQERSGQPKFNPMPTTAQWDLLGEVIDQVLAGIKVRTNDPALVAAAEVWAKQQRPKPALACLEGTMIRRTVARGVIMNGEEVRAALARRGMGPTRFGELIGLSGPTMTKLTSDDGEVILHDTYRKFRQGLLAVPSLELAA